MVFHPTLFGKYMDQWMNFRVYYQYITRTTPLDEGQLPQLLSFAGYADNVYALTANLTKVQAAVAEHFDCPSVEYFPLEISGGQGS